MQATEDQGCRVISSRGILSWVEHADCVQAEGTLLQQTWAQSHFRPSQMVGSVPEAVADACLSLQHCSELLLLQRDPAHVMSDSHTSQMSWLLSGGVCAAACASQWRMGSRGLQEGC